MKYIEFREKLKKFRVFSFNDILSIDSKFDRRRLTEWREKGYIHNIIKGYYFFTDIDLSEEILFEIANKIYKPSYISLETALSYYGLIPECLYGITSVSTKKTNKFNTYIASFLYRSIKNNLFFGYNIVKIKGINYKIASMEKALLDYLYLNPHIKNSDDFSSLRINKDNFLEKVNKDNFFDYASKFGNKLLIKRAEQFWEFIKND